MVFIPEYILILLILIIVDYSAGILIESSSGTKRKIILATSILANVGFLGFFKYYNFFIGTIQPLFQSVSIPVNLPLLKFILPIGLSFHTFQSMSYTIEVYRGKQKTVRDFLLYSVYVLFYPQLVAGPIERPQNLLHQFAEEHSFDKSRVISGLRLMLWGFFKKVVVADRLALLVNAIYSNPKEHDGISLLIATYAFAIQIYCDFSAYSDIAIGSARVMGINLMTNFKYPYISKSISEFWSRWHISLSTWFRDYLYIPLGGSRVRKYRWYSNLLIVFIVSGLWHGANLTFIMWGFINGFYLVSSLITQNWREKFIKIIGVDKYPYFLNIVRVFITFHLVTISWVFFRAASISEAFYVLMKIVKDFSFKVSQISGLISLTDALIIIFSLIILEIVQMIDRKHTIDVFLAEKLQWQRWGIYYAFLMMIFLYGVFHNPAQFIYFQF